MTLNGALDIVSYRCDGNEDSEAAWGTVKSAFEDLQRQVAASRNPTTKLGLYRHYKGALYRVLFTALDSTNGIGEGRLLVVYVSLEHGGIHVRAETQFREVIGTNEDGTEYPRFKWISE